VKPGLTIAALPARRENRTEHQNSPGGDHPLVFDRQGDQRCGHSSEIFLPHGRQFITALTTALLLAADPSAAAQNRNPAVREAFVAANPCPDPAARAIVELLWLRPGACPGWEVDHAEPLCAGGADAIENLQWLTVEQHRLKTKIDVRRCAVLRDLNTPRTAR